MKLSDLKTIDQITEERRRKDPAFAAEWDKTAFARDVANAVIRYRTKHNLTQQALADATGLKQSAIARLENGEHAPSLSTLTKLTAATGLRFHLEISGGDVAVPSVVDPTPALTFRFAVSFSVLSKTGDDLPPDELHSQGELLMVELLKLEECNPSMCEPATSTDAGDSVVTAEMTLTAESESKATEVVMGICRTAIHAMGGRTPDWAPPPKGKAGADFRRKGTRFDYV